MEIKERNIDVDKRTWHTPELRKTIVRDDTQFSVNTGPDGIGSGIRS